MPLSCGETCKMASRLHYDIANTHVLLIVNWGEALTELGLEIFKRRNENLPYRILHFVSGRKFSFLSFKISFVQRRFLSFGSFSFFACKIQRKKMNIRKKIK